MKKLLHFDSLRGRLIFLTLIILALIQICHGITLEMLRMQHRRERAIWLAQQSVEWYERINGKTIQKQHDEIAMLSRMYSHSEWTFHFSLNENPPAYDGFTDQTSPAKTARTVLGEALEEISSPPPAFSVSYANNAGRPALRIAIQLDNGLWISITPLRNVYDRLERLQRILLFSEFFFFLGIMFFVLYRATSQLASLRKAAEIFAKHSETEEKLPEEGFLEIRETARSLNFMRERVLSGIEERNRMLSALRHDIRTPLTRLRLWAEEVQPEELRERIFDNAGQIQDMVNQSIQLAESLNTNEKWVSLDLGAFLESLVDDYAEEGKNVSMAASEPYGVVIRTRPVCLRRCIANLVENALAYAGDAELNLKKGSVHTIITVADHGPGIPDNMLSEVCKPWVRLEHSRNRKTGGTGLGLTIASNMAVLSGAELKLSHSEHGGLQASILFPS